MLFIDSARVMFFYPLAGPLKKSGQQMGFPCSYKDSIRLSLFLSLKAIYIYLT